MAREPNRYDDDDDRPRRRRSPDGDDGRDEPSRDRYSRESTSKKMSVLGLLSLIGGIGSLVLSFIPCVGSMAIVSGVIGMLLGLIGLFVAGGSNHGKGLPIAGTVLNVLSIIIAVVWLFIIGGMGKWAEQAAVLEAQRQVEIETGDAIKIPASKLGNEFESNVVNAEAKYKGKLLEVTGKVKMVSKERVGKITVEIGDDDTTIDCEFGSSKKDDLIGVDIGNTVTIRGMCKGVGRAKVVILETCVLVKGIDLASLGRAIPVTVATLLEDYKGNEITGDEKYAGKQLELSGKVARVVKGTGSTIGVFLKGDGEDDFEEIFCEFDKTAQNALKSFTVGKSVKVQGTCEGRKNGVVTLTNCSIPK